MLLDTEADLIQVSLNQFYGIEVNDFAVSVAKTALWIAESQMFEKTRDLIYTQVDYLPIKSYSNIVEGNALKMDWNDVVDKYSLDYIIGNPPFIGQTLQTKEQKNELRNIYITNEGKTYKKAGKIDYVAGWFFKAAELIKDSKVKVSFVSTNSITQGEQVSYVWKLIYERFQIKIFFAYNTFKWNSEASDKANVHVVIIGFSHEDVLIRNKKLYQNKETFEIVDNINPYLIEGKEIFVESISKTLSNVPPMYFGSMARDGGNFFLTEEEKNSLLMREPKAKQFIKNVYGSREFINKIDRYVLWLKDATPAELRTMPLVLERIKKVKEFREESKAASTRKFAETPTLFAQDAQPNTDFLLVPSVSSENRKYVPIGFMSSDDIATNLVNIVPNATLYEFGILTSNVHMAWMRAVAGRLEMRYRYTSTLVYNTYPWPLSNKQQTDKIEHTAQGILKARSLYPDSTFADLYHELTMPPELRKAHQENDKAVMEAYGMLVGETTESDSVAILFELYEDLIESQSK